MTANIVEIFRSVQGEGKYLGLRQVFIRFAGCNLNCIWCDTPAARKKEGYKIFTAEQLLRQVLLQAKGCHSVSLTGGEPLLQRKFLSEFLPLLRRQKISVYLETNGICHHELRDVIRYIDIISMDIKLPSSARERPLWLEHLEFLRVARQKEVFIKAVISADTQKEDIARMATLIGEVDRNIPLILQPGTQRFYARAVKKALAYQEYCLKCLADVRVIPQTHKVLKIK